MLNQPLWPRGVSNAPAVFRIMATLFSGMTAAPNQIWFIWLSALHRRASVVFPLHYRNDLLTSLMSSLAFTCQLNLWLAQNMKVIWLTVHLFWCRNKGTPLLYCLHLSVQYSEFRFRSCDVFSFNPFFCCESYCVLFCLWWSFFCLPLKCPEWCCLCFS